MTTLARRGQNCNARGTAVYGLLLILLILCGCSSPPPTSPTTPRPAGNTQVAIQPLQSELPVKPVSVLEFIKGLNLFDENDKAAMLRAWKRVTDDSKYRVARADDFRIPERFKKESYWSDVEHALERPYMSGEMNGNYNDNLALLAVDQTRTDAERFSIILFIGRASKAYEVHWLYRDKDLSRYTINRHSGDIYLQEFREDGTSSACDIEWDSGLKNYTCK